MDFIDWLKVAEENDLRVYEAIGILLNGSANGEYEYTSTGVSVPDYDSWNTEHHSFTFDQIANPKEARVKMDEERAVLRKKAEEESLARRLQGEKDLKILQDAEELAEYARLRAKFEKEGV